MNEKDSVGWGNQLAEWLEKSNYRDNAHLNLLKHLEKKYRFESFLDIGCGTGFLVDYCSRFCRRSIGVDLSIDIINYHNENTHLNVIHGNVTNLPFGEGDTFDAVACLGLIEHLDDPVLGMKEIRRVTRGRGYALISVPNKLSVYPLLVPIWFAAGGRYKHGWRHMVGKMYTKSSFTHDLQTAGWEVDEIFPFKSSSLLEWSKIPYSKSFGDYIENMNLVNRIFGIMLCAVCRK